MVKTKMISRNFEEAPSKEEIIKIVEKFKNEYNKDIIKFKGRIDRLFNSKWISKEQMENILLNVKIAETTKDALLNMLINSNILTKVQCDNYVEAVKHAIDSMISVVDEEIKLVLDGGKNFNIE